MKLRKSIKLLKRGNYNRDLLPFKITSYSNPRIQKYLKDIELDFSKDQWLYYSEGYLQFDSKTSKEYPRQCIPCGFQIPYLHKTLFGLTLDYEYNEKTDEYEDYLGGGCLSGPSLEDLRVCTKTEIKILEKLFKKDGKV